MKPVLLAATAILTSLGATQAEEVSSIFVVPGSSCVSDSHVLTYDEAAAASRDVCRVLGTWYIARLAEGGSMDGPGYGCGIRQNDTRELGHILCSRAPDNTKEMLHISTSLEYVRLSTEFIISVLITTGLSWLFFREARQAIKTGKLPTRYGYIVIKDSPRRFRYGIVADYFFGTLCIASTFLLLIAIFWER